MFSGLRPRFTYILPKLPLAILCISALVIIITTIIRRIMYIGERDKLRLKIYKHINTSSGGYHKHYKI